MTIVSFFKLKDIIIYPEYSKIENILDNQKS